MHLLFDKILKTIQNEACVVEKLKKKSIKVKINFGYDWQ